MSLSQTNEDWPAKRREKLWISLLLSVYGEFVYKQRDQRMWEAGFEMICKLPCK